MFEEKKLSISEFARFAQSLWGRANVQTLTLAFIQIWFHHLTHPARRYLCL